MNKPTVLILCTGNSCRSHMAEGFLRAEAGDLFTVHSAGSRPKGEVHPKAVAVMAEAGIDLSAHTSKPLEPFLQEKIDTVITVCDNAAEACPVFPGELNRYHWSFVDPDKATGSEEEVMAVFRGVRDEIARTFGAYAAGYREALAQKS